MSNLREAVAATALANLGWDENRERAIDRVAACGRVSPLGLALWKLRYLLESSSYPEAQRQLIIKYRERYKHEKYEIVVKLVDQALHEFLSPFCQTCEGRKHLMAGDLKIICSACEGSGVRRYSNEERAGTMQLSYATTKHVGYKIAWLVAEMTTLDRIVNEALVFELERV